MTPRPIPHTVAKTIPEPFRELCAAAEARRYRIGLTTNLVFAKDEKGWAVRVSELASIVLWRQQEGRDHALVFRLEGQPLSVVAVVATEWLRTEANRR